MKSYGYKKTGASHRTPVIRSSSIGEEAATPWSLAFFWLDQALSCAGGSIWVSPPPVRRRQHRKTGTDLFSTAILPTP